MANLNAKVNGLARQWELAKTNISSATDSDVAMGGIQAFNGKIYIITSGTVLMTIQIKESPNGTDWITIDEEEIFGNHSYQITSPFNYLKVTVSKYTSGTITSIPIIGQTS